ncbi:hypothetical protein EDC96DRAFT_351642 [Choanephora cucurbitarum]|nr:hypothetical protein EDC96DRAFT_351642 [Choanephora cucurbitarum]
MTIHYIRFLKPPPTECLIGQHFTIVWTIESDLGDQTYWETVPVIISLQGSPQLGLRELTADPKIKSKKKAVFKPYAQTKPGLSTDVSVVFDPMRGGGIVTQLVIEQLPGKPVEIGQQVSIQLCLSLAPVVRSEPTSHPVWHEAYQFQSSLWIVPAWSCPILTTAAKQRHREVSESSDQAERWIKLPNQRHLQIKEDAVQSIARHVWDCGLGMCQFLFEQAIDTVFDEVVELVVQV